MKTTLFSSEKLSHWKAAILKKKPYAWNQIRTTFSGPSVSKILRVGSQGPPCHDIVPVLHNPSNVWASNLCFSEIFWGHTLYDKQLGAWISHYLVGAPFSPDVTLPSRLVKDARYRPLSFWADSTLSLVGSKLSSLEAWRQIFHTTYPMKFLEWYARSLSLFLR